MEMMENETWLIPIYSFYKEGKNRKYKFVHCLCKCGNSKDVRDDSYRNMSIRSCGCYSKLRKENQYGFKKRIIGPINKINLDNNYYPLYDFYGYYISLNGDVYSLKTKTKKKQSYSKKGYRRVNLSGSTQNVHRLVAKTFILNVNKEDTVNHKDFNKENNHVSNLEWVSNKDNLKHRYDLYKNNTFRNPNAKLTHKDVVEIKKSNISLKELSIKYGVHTKTIKDIKENKTWEWLKL